MSEHIDTLTLRARLREYDPSLPRCPERVEEQRNYAPDYTPEDERALWDMPIYTPCCRPAGHDGPCRNSRLVLGFPGLATLTALLDEVERLREETEVLQQLNEGEAWSKKHVERRECERERAAVVAWLREDADILLQRYDRSCAHVDDLAQQIERGDHRRPKE